MPRILVVDGDAEQRAWMESVLRKAGYDVVGEDNGEAALVRICLGRFDVIIMDLMLPGMMGHQLISHLDKEGLVHPPPVIVATAINEWGVRQMLRDEAKRVTVLTKPFNSTQLEETLAAVLDANPPAIAELSATVSFDPPPLLPQEAGMVCVTFSSPEEFLQEYMDNIAFGGMFIPTEVGADFGQILLIEVGIPSSAGELRRVRVEAEVVSKGVGLNGIPGLRVQFMARAETVQAFQAALAEARADVSVGRPLRVLIHGMATVPDTLRRVLPDTDLMIVSAGAHQLEHGAVDQIPDLILLRVKGPEAARLARAVRALLRRSAFIPILVTGPDSALFAFEKAGVDAFFRDPDEHDAFVATAAVILKQARRRYQARTHYAGEVRLRLGNMKLFSRGLNLSNRGLAVATKLPVDIGRVLDLEVSLPDGRPPVRVQGRVVWTDWRQDHGLWCVGITFVDLVDEARSRVRSHVAEAFLECAAGLLDYSQRVHVRVPLRSAVQLGGNGSRTVGECMDLSEGGFGVCSPRELEVGDNLQFALELPDGQRPLRERARVTWAVPEQGGGSWRLGLAFEDLSDGAADRIHSFVVGAV